VGNVVGFLVGEIDGNAVGNCVGILVGINDGIMVGSQFVNEQEQKRCDGGTGKKESQSPAKAETEVG